MATNPATPSDNQPVVTLADVEAAYARMLKSDVKYRFVIDIASMA